MSSFKCEICGANIVLSPNGHCLTCEHYPIESILNIQDYYWVCDKCGACVDDKDNNIKVCPSCGTHISDNMLDNAARNLYKKLWGDREDGQKK